jgi:hypothetical protein
MSGLAEKEQNTLACVTRHRPRNLNPLTLNRAHQARAPLRHRWLTLHHLPGAPPFSPRTNLNVGAPSLRLRSGQALFPLLEKGGVKECSTR